MDKIRKFQTLEDRILILRERIKIAELSVKEILSTLSGRGRSLILILFSIPFCQPLQIPGLSTPFGFLIAFMGLRIVFGKRVWLPKKLLERKLPSPAFEKILDKTLVFVRKIKSWIRPRLLWMCHSYFMGKLNGAIIFVLGILLAFPLPIPLSNLIAAWAIFLIALGMLEDDGFFVLIGYFVFFVTVVGFLLIGLTAKNILQAS